MSDNDEDEDFDKLESLSPPTRCKHFHNELNNFLCSRAEEWDLNKYELIGVMVSELFSQLAENNDDDEDDDEIETNEDEEDEDEEDEEEEEEDETTY